jgi:chromosome segregation ATPase
MDEEKSKVLGIRLDTDERKRFDEFVTDEGKNNKEFLTTLLNLYELNKGKVKNINLVGDIEVLEGYTNKIHQSFINIIDKLESQKGDISEKSDKDLQIYKNRVNDLESKIDTTNTINSSNEEKLTIVNNENATLKEQSNQLYSSLQDKLTIIEEYKNKNDILTGLLADYKHYKTENEELKGLLSEEKNKVIDKDTIIKDNDYNINELNKSIEELKNFYKNNVGKLKSDHEQELHITKDKLNIEKDRYLLELKQLHQEELEKIQSKHNLEIEKYQVKYKSLLEDLEKSRATRTTAKKNPIAGINKQNK